MHAGSGRMILRERASPAEAPFLRVTINLAMRGRRRTAGMDMHHQKKGGTLRYRPA